MMTDVCSWPIGEEALTNALTAAGQTFEEIADMFAQQVHPVDTVTM